MANKKSTPKRKVAPVYEEVEVPVEESILTKAEEFYIENNPSKSATEMAEDLGKPLAIVKTHLHRTQGSTRMNKLLIRDKGCTVMTAGASEMADESRRGYVSQQSIDMAVSRGDYEEAARLQKMIKVHRKNKDEEARKRQEGHVFYMHAPKKNSTEVRR